MTIDMPDKSDEIIVRSEEVQDILGRVPAWITRNGMLLVAAIMLLLFIGSWVFKYPDIIDSSIIVTTENPPAKLVSRVDGKIIDLYVKDKQIVVKDQLIALIENSARYEDVVDLKIHLKWLVPFFTNYDISKKTVFGDSYSLGEIQSQYTMFRKIYHDYINFTERDYFKLKVKAIQDQVRVYNMYYDRQWAKRSVIKEELGIVQNKFNRDSALYRKGVLSLVEFENSKQNQLTKQYGFEEIRTVLAETQMRILELKQSVIDMQNRAEDEKKALQLSLSEAYSNLNGAIDVWGLNYLLMAPVEGEIAFTKFWSKNQNVTRGQSVFTIIPQEESRIIGKVELPILRSGKVKPGQRVNIKFHNFPYMEYGIVEGRVDKISLVPTDNYYSLEVGLPNGLMTNYGKELEFNHEISGDAEIIAEDERLIKRLFNPLKSLLKERMAK
jgi:HlyD family secretion protein